MAISAVSVCNMALTRLGGATISALDEGSKESVICNQFFEQSRDAVLRDYKWNFATRRRVLAELGSTVAPWAHAYAYPADCLAAREIVSPSSTTAAIPFEVAGDGAGGRMILTDQDRAVLVYTARVTLLDSCDPLFVEAFSWKLAAEIALPLTQDKNLMQVMLTMYQNAIAQARTADANEGEADNSAAATWIEARLGYQDSLLVRR